MPVGKRLQILAGMAIAYLAAGGPAQADMVVLESTVSGFEAGDHVEADAIGSLPPGTYIKVLDQNSNVTKVFRGPAAANLPIGGLRGLPPKPRK